MNSGIRRCASCGRVVEDMSVESCGYCLTQFDEVPPLWEEFHDSSVGSDRVSEVRGDSVPDSESSGAMPKAATSSIGVGTKRVAGHDGGPAAEEQAADARGSASCRDSTCGGLITEGICGLCGVREYVLLELPWQRGWYRLVFGDSVVFGRIEGEFAHELADYLNVSRKHCTVALGERLTVVDHDSRNGTYVDDRRIASESPFELPAGAVLRLGRHNQRKRLTPIVVRVI